MLGAWRTLVLMETVEGALPTFMEKQTEIGEANGFV